MIKKYFLLLLAAILLTGVHGQNRQVDLPKNIPLQDILKSEKTKETCIIGFRLSKMFSLPIYQKQNIHDR